MSYKEEYEGRAKVIGTTAVLIGVLLLGTGMLVDTIQTNAMNHTQAMAEKGCVKQRVAKGSWTSSEWVCDPSLRVKSIDLEVSP